jgi:amino acid permease
MTITDPASIASTIAKAAIVALVTFSIPLQVHPCRASVDAVLRWRPNSARSPPPQPGNQPLLPSSNAATAPVDSHGAPVVAMSELRFALITSALLILSYITALNVSSLDRVLAYVGSSGSTAISFILPGLFYYKISDPDSIYHQRLSKEDDDVDFDEDGDEDENEDEGGLAGSAMLASVSSIRSQASGVSRAGSSRWGRWRWRRKWRWDLEHLETGLLRKLALCLSVYGVCVMIVCLTMNTFFLTAHH